VFTVCRVELGSSTDQAGGSLSPERFSRRSVRVIAPRSTFTACLTALPEGSRTGVSHVNLGRRIISDLRAALSVLRRKSLMRWLMVLVFSTNCSDPPGGHPGVSSHSL